MHSLYRLTKIRYTRMDEDYALNPYGAARLIVLIIGLLLFTLIPLDWVFPSGMRATQIGVDNASRVIPQIVRGLLLLLMLSYIALTGYAPSAYGFSIGLSLFLFTSYMFVSIFISPSELTSRLFYFIKSLLWIVTAIASYRFTLAGYLSATRIRYFAGVIVIISSAYTIPFCLYPNATHLIGHNADYSVLLWCIPLLLLTYPSLGVLVLVGLASIAVLVTVKRGAMLALFFSGIVFSAISIIISTRKKKLQDLIVIILVMAVIAIGLVWQWGNLEKRMEKDIYRGSGIGSGRGAFYPIIVAEWYNSSTFSFLFGKGFFTVRDTLDNKYGERIYAHSDWLEILHDMGILGIVLFVYLHFRMLLIVCYAFRQRNPVTPALSMGYCIFALRNIYSQAILGASPTAVYFGLLLGYTVAAVNTRQIGETNHLHYTLPKTGLNKKMLNWKSTFTKV